MAIAKTIKGITGALTKYVNKNIVNTITEADAIQWYNDIENDTNYIFKFDYAGNTHKVSYNKKTGHITHTK